MLSISVLNPKASSDPYWRKMQKPGGGGESAPTGCFKCGRPGHWSRDCTLSPATTNPDLRGNDPTSFSLKFGKNDGKNLLVGAKESAVPKRGKQPRPKLTPEILMSDDGLGYVLRHFPRTFNYHGRGHEASDLGNLIALYAQWHSHLIPYYSFEQFIAKVEQLGTTRHVRMRLRELRERVADGGDPTKLHEPPIEQISDTEQETEFSAKNDAISIPSKEADTVMEDIFDEEGMQEDVLDEIYRKATEETTQANAENNSLHTLENTAVSEESSRNGSYVTVNCPAKIQITDAQRSRMEANRLKALQRAAAARAHAAT